MHLMGSLSRVSSPTNKILASLPREEFLTVLPYLEEVAVDDGEMLIERDRPLSHAFFPEERTLVALKTGQGVATAFVGTYGLVGSLLLLGARKATKNAVVMMPGKVVRMAAERFLAALDRNGNFHRLVIAYVRHLLLVTTQNAACIQIHSLQNRLARILLVFHDEIGSNEFVITAEEISRMLPAPRSEIAKRLAIFADTGVIEYRGGKIAIVNRKKLEANACECYWAISENLKETGAHA